MIKCTKCGNEVKEGVKFCSKCGNNILEQQEKSLNETLDEKKILGKICANCGNEIGEGTIFCPKCGSKITADNNQEQFSGKSRQNTDGASKEEYQYTRPEKVRFSERWLLVKIAFLGIFGLGFWDLLIVKGLGNLDLLVTIAAFALFSLFDYFIDRTINDYAGNPHMLKIPFGDKTIIKVCNIIAMILLIIATLCAYRYGVAVESGINVWGIFSLKTWIAKPVRECYRLLHWEALLAISLSFVCSNREKEWIEKNVMHGNSLIAKFMLWID